MFAVMFDNEVLTVGTHDECFVYLLMHQGNSVSYATTYGGYSIVEVI